MLISDIYKPANIKINLESEDKEELFEELVNFLVDVEHFDNRDEILEKLWERERKMTTGIAPRIAIPHTKLTTLNRIVGVLGISRTGIEYDSLDGRPVNIVMFLLGNENKPDEHIKVLKNIATLLNNPDFYDHLVKCTTAEQVTETIIEFEDLEKYSNEG